MYSKIKFLALLIAVMTLGACQKDLITDGMENTVLSDSEALTLKMEGETKTVTLTDIPEDWSIQSDSYDTWLKAEKKDGNLVVEAGPNDKSSDRFTIVQLNVRGGKKAITVTQFGTLPVIKLENNDGIAVFDYNAQSNKVFKVIANSNNWRVDRLDQNNKWLRYTIDTEKNTLTLNLDKIEKGSEWEQISRSDKLYLTNGNQHFLLNVIQNGYLQFQLPVMNDMDVNHINDLENKRGNVRDKQFEIEQLMPRNVDRVKAFYAFKSAGAQTPKLLYSRDFNFAYMVAEEGKSFEPKALASWLEQNNFNEGNTQRGENESEYFYTDDKLTRLVHINNNSNNDDIHHGMYKSAWIRYYETTNQLKIDEIGKNMESFPMTDISRLNDTSYKLEQVIAFEKTRGMIPKYDHELTLKTKDPLCEYAYLVFVPEIGRSNVGDLIYVVYSFNWQGVTEKEIKDLKGLSNNPNLSGTVGRRQDVYVGNDYVYRKKELYYEGSGYYDYTLNPSFRNALQQKGYKEVPGSQSSSYYVFVRGNEDVIDAYPMNDDVVFEYYKSKALVDIAKTNPRF